VLMDSAKMSTSLGNVFARGHRHVLGMDALRGGGGGRGGWYYLLRETVFGQDWQFQL